MFLGTVRPTGVRSPRAGSASLYVAGENVVHPYCRGTFGLPVRQMACRPAVNGGYCTPQHRFWPSGGDRECSTGAGRSRTRRCGTRIPTSDLPSARDHRRRSGVTGAAHPGQHEGRLRIPGDALMTCSGADDGNRTRATCLGSRSSTIELHRHGPACAVTGAHSNTPPQEVPQALCDTPVD